MKTKLVWFVFLALAVLLFLLAFHNALVMSRSPALPLVFCWLLLLVMQGRRFRVDRRFSHMVLIASAFVATSVSAQTILFRRVTPITNGAATVRIDRPMQLQRMAVARAQPTGTNTLSTGSVAVVTAASAGAVTSALPTFVITASGGGTNGAGSLSFLSTTNIMLFPGDTVALTQAGTNAGLFLLEGPAPRQAE